MVFQDYELVSTARVNAQRRKMNVYRHRLFLAGGGYSSVYLGGLASYAFMLKYITSEAGMPLMVRSAVAAPAFVAGFLGGALMFGEP